MRSFSVEVKSDSSFHDTYYVEADNLISVEEIRDYIATISAIDAIYVDDTIEELEVCDPVEMDNDSIMDILTDIRVRPKLIFTALNNLSNVVLSIYHREKDYKPKQSEFFIFSAAAGQDADVTAIGKTNSEKSLEEVINDGWLDCISQLKRYFQVPGTVIATGLFTIQTTSEEEYELERSEREIVFI